MNDDIIKSVQKYLGTDIILKETYKKPNGLLHREDGPAVIVYYENGNIKSEEYYIDGERHREDGPTQISYYSDGLISEVSYFLNGIRHRDQAPAIQTFYNNGKKSSELYYINNRLHREDGPAIAYWYEDGSLNSEEYHINGLLHRENAPAKIRYLLNGRYEYVKYYINGQVYRENGPAFISFFTSGDISEVNFYEMPDTRYRKDNKPCSIVYHPNGQTRSEVYKNTQGVIHRDDGPAQIEYAYDGRIMSESYYMNGKLCRRFEDGPANTKYSKFGNKTLEVYEFTERLGTKTVTRSKKINYSSGKPNYIEFELNKKLHREDGPAAYYINSSDDRRYYVHGKKVNGLVDECRKKINKRNIMATTDIYRLTSYSIVAHEMDDKELIEICQSKLMIRSLM